MQDISQVIEAYQAFPAQFKSVVLGTVSSQGIPQASYAPCVVDEYLNIYIYVSGLSAHTQNISATGKASALFIEDEAQTPQVFARKRLSYDCMAMLIERESDQWTAIVAQFEARFGNIIEVMKGLADFRVFQLKPHGGNFVLGFGAAYSVDPNNLGNLVHRGK
ncbi:MAG: pyridoxamine 5'-phosphate oxidase family protein [Cyanobacteria bacterium P01_A01_bin.116]